MGITHFDDARSADWALGHLTSHPTFLGEAAGTETVGLRRLQIPSGHWSTPAHEHGREEEIFVVLAGSGTLKLGFGAEAEETAVYPGHVISRPAGTGIAHGFRAGQWGLTFLAYGPRDPADVCYYPRSGKIAFRGVGLTGQVESLDYWDGED